MGVDAAQAHAKLSVCLNCVCLFFVYVVYDLRAEGIFFFDGSVVQPESHLSTDKSIEVILGSCSPSVHAWQYQKM